MSPGTSSESSGGLHPQEVFLRALNGLDADDRTAVCDYVFNNEPGLDSLRLFSSVQDQATRLVDRLARSIRFDSDVDPAASTQPLYDEARDWLVWAGGFSIAQQEVEAAYAKVRSCERWAQAHSSNGEATIQDARSTLAGFCKVLERNIADAQPAPTPRPAKTLPIVQSRVSYRTLVVSYYMLTAILAFAGAIAYRSSVLDWDWVRNRILMVFVHGPIGGCTGALVYLYFFDRKYRTPAALMQQDIECMRKRARQWILLWKALLALA
ncbi:hypothetical protein EV714DRAFT_172646, partial [Schizophyllum commune]